MDEPDHVAWSDYLARVQPLPGRTRPRASVATFLPTPPAASLPPAAVGTTQKHSSSLAPLVIGRQPAGLDNATWRHFRSGRLRPGRSLDLHGHSAERAYRALEAMLRGAAAEQLRCVEVITGRGTREGHGVIRREFPLWLNLPGLRPLVLAAAHPHASNTGATRLLLRRRPRPHCTNF